MSGSAEGDKPSKAFLGDLAARIGAGPPKKPVGLVKKKAVSAEDVQDVAPQNPKLMGGLGGLGSAAAAAAASRTNKEGSAKEDDKTI